MILMGDFNTVWNDEDNVLQDLCTTLNLKAYQPENSEISTFPRSQNRLDWILISEIFEFTSHAVLKDVLSDHRAVVAEIQLVNLD